MVGENGPPLEGWQVESRTCPIPCSLCARPGNSPVPLAAEMVTIANVKPDGLGDN